MPYCGAPFIKSRKQSNQLLRQSSLTTPMPSANAFPSAATYSQLNNKYDQIEDLSYDKVDSRVYLYYIDALGIAPICIALIFYAAYQVFEVASKLWLSAWASTKSPEDMEGKLTNADSNRIDPCIMWLNCIIYFIYYYHLTTKFRTGWDWLHYNLWTTWLTSVRCISCCNITCKPTHIVSIFAPA